jgi:dTDP-4-dehydrorhamnose reductase
MGGGPAKDKKFVHKFLRQLREGKTKVSAVNDKAGSPTYTHDFAANLREVIESENYGLYHMVGQGECSRFEVAEEILRLLNLTDRIALEQVPSSHWQDEYFAPRPRSEKLTNLKLTLRGMNRMRHWKEALAVYIASHDWGIPH